MSEDMLGKVKNQDAVFGIAAISLLEAIILTLRAKGALSEEELDDAFDAAIAAHENQAHASEANKDAARLLGKLRVGGNGVNLDT